MAQDLNNKYSKACWCSAEETFTVILTKKIMHGGWGEVDGWDWSFVYKSVAVCDPAATDVWNDIPPTITVTDDEIYIRNFRRIVCRPCTDNKCGYAVEICSGKAESGGKGTTYNKQDLAVMRIGGFARQPNVSMLRMAMFDFASTYFKCSVPPYCSQAVPLCKGMIPDPPAKY